MPLKLASVAFVAGAMLMFSMPAVSYAQGHGRSGGGHSFGGGGRAFSGGGGGRAFSGGGSYAPRGGNFASPRGFSRGYVAPRSYGRPIYRGRYGGGWYGGGTYFGFGVPYGYYYAPGYAYGYGYDPYSYAPPPAPVCNNGTYDQYGNWIPDPNCYSSQGYYPPQ